MRGKNFVYIPIILYRWRKLVTKCRLIQINTVNRYFLSHECLNHLEKLGKVEKVFKNFQDLLRKLETAITV